MKTMKGYVLGCTAGLVAVAGAQAADLPVQAERPKKIIQHLFCRTCGVQPFARGTMPDGSPAIAVNMRCLEGIDLDSLKPMPFDGRNI